MSWSLSVTPREDRDELLSAIEHVEPEHEVEEAAEAQIAAAKEAAKSVVLSDAFPDSSKPLSVTMNGHHGEGVNTTNIGIAQVESPPEEPA